ncbi:MAG: hypothetical protein WBC71_13100 [Salaquimonas sp.]
MVEKSIPNAEAQRKLDAKKKALRENLKRRKVQIKDLSKANTGELSPRNKALKSDKTR